MSRPPSSHSLRAPSAASSKWPDLREFRGSLISLHLGHTTTSTVPCQEAEKAQHVSDPDVSTLQSHNTSPTASVISPSIGIDKVSNHSHETEIFIGWDGPDDPKNPRNWTNSRRWVVTLVVSLFTFIRFDDLNFLSIWIFTWRI